MPEKVIIHAKACFRLCPNDRLFQDDLESLTKFINSKDHLNRNIANIQFECVVYDGADGCGTFEHSSANRNMSRTLFNEVILGGGLWSMTGI